MENLLCIYITSDFKFYQSNHIFINIVIVNFLENVVIIIIN